MGVSTQSVRQAVAGLVSTPPREASDGDDVAGVRPRVVVEPAGEEEVAAVLAFADREGLKVLVRGGGSQLGVGAPPSGGDILVSTARLNGIVEHAPHDQTISLQAGMRLADLQRHLAASRQWLALDPAVGEGATLGGVIATNASGPRRLRFGGVRDQILGVRVALCDGTIAQGGGKVVKNVAGYDLPKLFCGALGTLGVVVAANFRLYPLPDHTRTVTLASPSAATLGELALAINASTLVPTALDVMGPSEPGEACALAARFESGVRAAVEEQAEALLALASDLAVSARTLEGGGEADFWRRADERVRGAGGEEGAVLLKASLLPTEVAGWLGRLDSIAGENGLAAHWRAHAGHGIVFARVAGAAEAIGEALGALREAARAGRGSVVVQDAPPALLRALDVWGPVPALDVMRRLKERFDPHGTLNPGRYVGGI